MLIHDMYKLCIKMSLCNIYILEYIQFLECACSPQSMYARTYMGDEMANEVYIKKYRRPVVHRITLIFIRSRRYRKEERERERDG
jgi:hypothetical protein